MPPLETESAVLKVTVFVAVRFPVVSNPEIRALPWTLKLVAGEVVEIPKKFADVKTELRLPAVL